MVRKLEHRQVAAHPVLVKNRQHQLRVRRLIEILVQAAPLFAKEVLLPKKQEQEVQELLMVVRVVVDKNVLAVANQWQLTA